MAVKLEFISPSWNDIFEMCVEGAERIDQLGIKFDIIIALSRGGLVPGRLISDLLEIRDVIVLDVKYYFGIGIKIDKPRITELVRTSITSKNVLLVDDVVDSGESIKASADYLSSFKPSVIKIFTLNVKPKRIINPDIFIKETSAWIIYPWELLECFKELEEKGYNINEIAEETGLKKEALTKVKRLYEKRRRETQTK
jgi:hypoxanthine phosphoribosyltransferase